jgi:hypothetical protein
MHWRSQVHSIVGLGSPAPRTRTWDCSGGAQRRYGSPARRSTLIPTCAMPGASTLAMSERWSPFQHPFRAGGIALVAGGRPAKKSAASEDAAPKTARKVALRGLLEDCSASAPSTSPGGRDQSLVRRSQTRHHDVRHWITSFPLLHLIQQMAPRSPGVKEIPPRARQGRPVAGESSPSAARRSRSTAPSAVGLFCRWISQGGRGTTAWNVRAQAGRPSLALRLRELAVINPFLRQNGYPGV